MKETDITSIFKHIYNVMRRYGVQNVIHKLRQLEAQGIDHFETEVIEAIIVHVTCQYEISRKDLFEGKKRGACSDARKMCYILMKENLSLNEMQIAWYFDRHNKAVYRAMYEYAQMNNSIKWQREFLEKKRIVDEKISMLVNQRLSTEG